MAESKLRWSGIPCLYQKEFSSAVNLGCVMPNTKRLCKLHALCSTLQGAEKQKPAEAGFF
jgi:hypothetical protein